MDQVGRCRLGPDRGTHDCRKRIPNHQGDDPHGHPLGVFAAMQFAVSVMTDSALQSTYFAGIHDDARELFAVRARYTQYLSEQDGASE